MQPLVLYIQQEKILFPKGPMAQGAKGQGPKGQGPGAREAMVAVVCVCFFVAMV